MLRPEIGELAGKFYVVRGEGEYLQGDGSWKRVAHYFSSRKLAEQILRVTEWFSGREEEGSD